MSGLNEEQKKWVPTNPDYNPAEPMQVGGQAVLEGVMMRGRDAVATAVRRRDGSIVVDQIEYRPLARRYRWLKVPILRGAVGLIEMMVLGIKSLNFSADVALRDEEILHAGGNGTTGASVKRRTDVAVAFSVIIALVLGVGFFFVAPLYLATHLLPIEQSAVAFNLVTGLIRAVMLIGYIAAISAMKDIRRLFEYHGAEHKSVFAFELGADLAPTSVEPFSRFHPRCGTSFLLIVVAVAIVLFALLDAVLIAILGGISLPVRLAVHIPLIPIVAGAAYEVIRFSAKHTTTWWGRLLIAPGLWLQRLTTKEPDASQIEVAVVALKCALGLADPRAYALAPAPEAMSDARS